MDLKTPPSIHRKNLLVILKNGKQLLGIISGMLTEKDSYEKIVQISILPDTDMTVAVKTHDIAEIIELEEENGYLNIAEI